MKTQKDVSSSMTEPDGITAGKMGFAATIPTVAEVTPDERHHLISEAAYYRAEHRSFVPGYELEDWLNAETEIETMLTKSGLE